MGVPTNGHRTSTPPALLAEDPAQAATGENIAALCHSDNSLRHDGLDDEAIGALAPGSTTARNPPTPSTARTCALLPLASPRGML